MTKSIFATILVTMSMFALARPARAVEAALKDKYHAVQVDRFDVRKDAQFPADYMAPLQEDIVMELQKSGKFVEVLRPDEKTANPGTPVLRLIGTITHFNPGSRAKRYFGGYGAGSTVIFAHLAFIDASTGQTLTAEEIRATLGGGFFGGDSRNVVREFARQVVNTTKLMLAKRLPTANEPPLPSSGASPATGGTSLALDRHVVTISSRDFAGAAQKLNTEGAMGYRLVDFAATGSETADVAMEKSAALPQDFQYRLVHVRLPAHLQKDLNTGAADGFRLCPHTVAQLRGALAVLIMEKPPVPQKTSYQYRVHIPVRMASAEKDINKDQSEGYIVVETSEILGQPLVISEKAVEKSSGLN